MVAPPGPGPLAMLLACLLLASGCAWAPRSRVDEAHKLVQALRAENAQLKDASLTLKVQNHDLVQRAVDDARAIKALEVANEQFERSIQGYQDERERMRAAFLDVERLARGGSTSVSDAGTAAGGRFRALARALPGGSYDEASGVLAVPAEALFPEGGGRPSPEGDAWLDELAVQVAASKPDRLDLRLVGPDDEAPVRRAGLGPDDDPARGLGRERARIVRDLVAARARVDPSRVAVSAPMTPRPPADVARARGAP